MTPLVSVPVVWVNGESGSLIHGDRIAPRQWKELENWARGRGVTLTQPHEAKPVFVPNAREVIATIEQNLVEAHDAIATQNGAAADEALTKARDELLAHPEIEVAAWLMAELERTTAARFTQVLPADRPRAIDALRRANALDGGRLAGIGEPVLEASDPTPVTRINVHAPRSRTVWLDSKELKGRIADLSEGGHHLRVTFDAQMIGAAWIWVGDKPADLSLPAEPCSSDDFLSTQIKEQRIVANQTTCERWLVAGLPTADHPLQAAFCHRSSCDPFHDARAVFNSTESSRSERHRWPTWATWTIAGTSAAALITTVVLASTGALSSPAHDSRFVYGGLRTH